MPETATGLDSFEKEIISPVLFADRLGEEYTSSVTNEHKRSLGQYFTPAEIARFMASYARCNDATVRILDPGCGVGILSCAVAEYLATSNVNLREIGLFAFENDLDLITIAERNFEHLSPWLETKNIHLTLYLCKNDFILHNSHLLNSEAPSIELYDIIIANPPYFKLPKTDPRVKAAKNIIYGQPNIYSIFMILATKLLAVDGQLIFITPRSFCSGSYFRVFRERFFSSINLQSIHLFNSRKEMFRRDKVQQENVIIAAKARSANQTAEAVVNIEISTSKGTEDISERKSKIYDVTSLLNLNSYQKILHLPVSNIDERVMAIFKTWDGSLHKYGLEISTGPVVDFRSIPFIRFRSSQGSVPLLYLHNVDAMSISWPVYQGVKGKPKGQYIKIDEKSLSRLVPNKNYVLLRRFSAKDDEKRLISAPYNKNCHPDCSYLGIENHLNYIYKPKGVFILDEVYGLSALLNSNLFDLYFRTFNGNINVSATELRDFPLPDMELIKLLGKEVIRRRLIANMELDEIVNEIFQLNFLLNE